MKVAYFGLYYKNKESKESRAVEMTKAFCEDRGYEFVGEYKDYERKRDKSDAYKKLLEDCDNGKVNYIIVKTFKTLGLGTPRWLTNLYNLSEKGVVVSSILEKMEIKGIKAENL